MRAVRSMFQRDSVYWEDVLKCQAMNNFCEKLIMRRIIFLANRCMFESSIF